MYKSQCLNYYIPMVTVVSISKNIIKIDLKLTIVKVIFHKLFIFSSKYPAFRLFKLWSCFNDLYHKNYKIYLKDKIFYYLAVSCYNVWNHSVGNHCIINQNTTFSSQKG